MNIHEAAELIRDFGRAIDDCKESTARMQQGMEAVDGGVLQWRRGYQAGLTKAIEITRESVGEEAKPGTVELMKKVADVDFSEGGYLLLMDELTGLGGGQVARLLHVAYLSGKASAYEGTATRAVRNLDDIKGLIELLCM